MAKFIFHLSTGYAGSKIEESIEISDDELNDCESDVEREALIQSHFEDWLFDQIDSGWEEVE